MSITRHVTIEDTQAGDGLTNHFMVMDTMTPTCALGPLPVLEIVALLCKSCNREYNGYPIAGRTELCPSCRAEIKSSHWEKSRVAVEAQLKTLDLVEFGEQLTTDINDTPLYIGDSLMDVDTSDEDSPYEGSRWVISGYRQSRGDDRRPLLFQVQKPSAGYWHVTPLDPDLMVLWRRANVE